VISHREMAFCLRCRLASRHEMHAFEKFTTGGFPQVCLISPSRASARKGAHRQQDETMRQLQRVTTGRGKDSSKLHWFCMATALLLHCSTACSAIEICTSRQSGRRPSWREVTRNARARRRGPPFQIGRPLRPVSPDGAHAE
jgi:hypothetical protein